MSRDMEHTFRVLNPTATPIVVRRRGVPYVIPSLAGAMYGIRHNEPAIVQFRINADGGCFTIQNDDGSPSPESVIITNTTSHREVSNDPGMGLIAVMDGPDTWLLKPNDTATFRPKIKLAVPAVNYYEYHDAPLMEQEQKCLEYLLDRSCPPKPDNPPRIETSMGIEHYVTITRQEAMDADTYKERMKMAKDANTRLVLLD